MGAARVALVVGNLALAALLVATAGADLGFGHAPHTLAYLALAGVAALAWPLLRRRRLTTLLLASAGAWSMLTGLLLVYVTPGLGQARAMGWWHGVISVAFSLAFLAHWARNQPRLATLLARLRERPPLVVALAGAWAALGALALASWTTPLRALFDDTQFFALTTLSLALALLAVMLGALVATGRRLRATDARNRSRGALDASLLALTWLALLTGLPLLYLGRELRGLHAYWHVAGWHAVLSVLLLALVVFHVGFNVRALRSHAR